MSDETESPDEAESKRAEADAPSSEAPSEPEKPKKKKKSKPAASEVDDPSAREIAVAFDAGNFARVRELGADLAKSDDPALAAVGRDYLARIAVDPVQIAFLGLCAVVLLTIAWIYVPH